MNSIKNMMHSVGSALSYAHNSLPDFGIEKRVGAIGRGIASLGRSVMHAAASLFDRASSEVSQEAEKAADVAKQTVGIVKEKGTEVTTVEIQKMKENLEKALETFDDCTENQLKDLIESANKLQSPTDEIKSLINQLKDKL